VLLVGFAEFQVGDAVAVVADHHAFAQGQQVTGIGPLLPFIVGEAAAA
jgi:hypothetical protein